LENKEFDLKAELKALGMTQKDFAEKTGFNVSTISIWNSKRKMSIAGKKFLETLIELHQTKLIVEKLKNKCLDIN